MTINEATSPAPFLPSAAPAAQQPDWPDASELADVTAQLAELPGLVFPAECDALKRRVAAASQGKAFWLQGGDCAETFVGTTSERVRGTIQTLLQMALILTYGSSVPVVTVGRMAGQFAKPRSRALETRDGITLPSYRGDAVNGLEFSAESRRPDPQRLKRVYHTSTMILNQLRGHMQSGFAELRQVHQWNAGFIDSPTTARYELMARDIDRAMAFLSAVGGGSTSPKLADVWVSHEALILAYERSMVRRDEDTGRLYDTSAHFLWIGERSRQLDGAHVELASRIGNPIGVKLGRNTTGDDALALIDKLDPDREPGRLTFITRMGANQIRSVLPPLVEKVRSSGAQVLWVCDPMHGNTFDVGGVKTRRLDDIVDEVRGFFEVHQDLGTTPGGIHIELTGNDVTECVGGADGLAEADLTMRYESACDPRLNHRQSLELAFLVAEMLAES